MVRGCCDSASAQGPLLFAATSCTVRSTSTACAVWCGWFGHRHYCNVVAAASCPIRTCHSASHLWLCLCTHLQAYAPAKLPFGQPHPDSVVETASLAAVEPPDITYQLAVSPLGRLWLIWPFHHAAACLQAPRQCGLHACMPPPPQPAIPHWPQAGPIVGLQANSIVLPQAGSIVSCSAGTRPAAGLPQRAAAGECRVRVPAAPADAAGRQPRRLLHWCVHVRVALVVCEHSQPLLQHRCGGRQRWPSLGRCALEARDLQPST